MVMRPVFLFALILLTVCASGIGCGRYSAPEPPENFSPMSVQQLVVRPQTTGVQFTWSAPGGDLRGRELRSMDGYRIYRKQFEGKSDLIDPRGYEEIGFIEDKHVAILKERREIAIAKNIPTRKVKIEPELTSFRYLDTTPLSGLTYLYKITPVNQGGVEGLSDNIIKIEFVGLSSTVFMVGVRGEEAIELPGDAAPREASSVPNEQALPSQESTPAQD